MIENGEEDGANGLIPLESKLTPNEITSRMIRIKSAGINDVVDEALRNRRSSIRIRRGDGQTENVPAAFVELFKELEKQPLDLIVWELARHVRVTFRLRAPVLAHAGNGNIDLIFYWDLIDGRTSGEDKMQPAASSETPAQSGTETSAAAPIDLKKVRETKEKQNRERQLFQLNDQYAATLTDPAAIQFFAKARAYLDTHGEEMLSEIKRAREANEQEVRISWVDRSPGTYSSINFGETQKIAALANYLSVHIVDPASLPRIQRFGSDTVILVFPDAQQ